MPSGSLAFPTFHHRSVPGRYDPRWVQQEFSNVQQGIVGAVVTNIWPYGPSSRFEVGVVDPRYPMGYLLRYGVSGTGTDETTNVQNAFLSAARMGCPVTGPSGLSVRVTEVGLYSGLSVYLPGVEFVKAGGALGSHTLVAQGTLGLASPLALDASAGDTALTVVDGSIFHAGDVCLLRSDRYVDPLQTLGQNQEFVEVESVVGNVVTFQGPIFRDYATLDDAELCGAYPVEGAEVEGLTITVPAGVNGGAFCSDLAYDLTMRGVVSNNAADDADFYVLRTAWAEWIGCRAERGQNRGPTGYGNGWDIDESSHNIQVVGCKSRYVSENAISNNCFFVDVIGHQDYGCYDTAWNTHGSGVQHCTLKGGSSAYSRATGLAVGQSAGTVGDNDITISDYDIYFPANHAVSVNAQSTKRNTNIRIENVRAYGPGRSIASASGCVVVESDYVDVIDFKVFGDGNTNLSSGVQIQNSVGSVVRGARVRDIVNGWGVQWSGCTGLVLDNNETAGISSSNFRNYNAAPSSGTIVTRNRTDDTTNTFVVGQDTRDGSNSFDGVVGESADRGDTDVTLVVGTDATTQPFATTLTGNRTVTLSTSNTWNGARFRVVRTGLGAFTLNVGGLKTIPSATAAFVDVMHNGTAWTLTGYGTL